MLCKNARSDDYWNIDGSRDSSDSWTGFAQFAVLEEKPSDGYMWSGWVTDKKAANIQARFIYGQNSGRNWERMLSRRRNINGPMENRNSIMQEDYEEFISLTLRTRSSKKPLGMLERNWKHQWLPPCLARQARKVNMVRPVVNAMRSNQNLRVSWKPVNLQDCVEESLPNHHEDPYCKKGGQFTATL